MNYSKLLMSSSVHILDSEFVDSSWIKKTKNHWVEREAMMNKHESYSINTKLTILLHTVKLNEDIVIYYKYIL